MFHKCTPKKQGFYTYCTVCRRNMDFTPQKDGRAELRLTFMSVAAFWATVAFVVWIY